jgi:hypothetical protein
MECPDLDAVTAEEGGSNRFSDGGVPVYVILVGELVSPFAVSNDVRTTAARRRARLFAPVHPLTNER